MTYLLLDVSINQAPSPKGSKLGNPQVRSLITLYVGYELRCSSDSVCGCRNKNLIRIDCYFLSPSDSSFDISLISWPKVEFAIEST
jgi:hypothetical protein